VPSELEVRTAELRFLEGVEKVEQVHFSTGDQFWVRFNRPIDLKRLQDLVEKNNYQLIKFGRFPSKLPRKLSEVLWDGVTHVIVKRIDGWGRFTSVLGSEPEGIAKIAQDLHEPFQIFIAMNEEGVRVLYDYLGVKYVAPVPMITAPAKPPLPVAGPTPSPPPRPVPSAVSPNATPSSPSTQDKKPTTP
jgi:hypothetical protein